MKYLLSLLLISMILSCRQEEKAISQISEKSLVYRQLQKTSIIILGNIQDAGSPHIACKKDCCKELFENPDPTRKVVSLGIFDSLDQKNYLIEASPDMVEQLKILKKLSASEKELPDGIFLTHAHIGHYTGLMYLGKEATNAKGIPVFTMPKMKSYLSNNGPWSQLVNTENIVLNDLNEEEEVPLSNQLKIIPFSVPHRDEYSETVGFKIIGPNKSALFIPDIDKWERWEKSIEEEIKRVDYAFLDATFYWGKEINRRDISQIPHPFIVESMQRFSALPWTEKAKIHFIHFNHTNPVLNKKSEQYKEVIENGFNIANFLDVFDL